MSDGETTFTRTCPACGRAFSYSRRGPGNRVGRHPTFCSPECRPGGCRRRSDEADDIGVSHPATTSNPLDPDEWEFVRAVDRYRREKRRPFPALSELLQVLKSLGYRKEPPP